MAAPWCLSKDEDGILLFKSGDVVKKVVELKDATGGIVAIYFNSEESYRLDAFKCTVPAYEARDSRFPPLHRATASQFIELAHLMMKMNKTSFEKLRRENAEDLPEELTKKYRCDYSFTEQVVKMRALHPEAVTADDMVMLTTGHRVWRSKCAAMLGFKRNYHNGTFGGHFKEAIYISCFSRRCFSQVVTLLNERGPETNRGLFRDASGVHSEDLLFSHLKDFIEGKIDKKTFNVRMFNHKKRIAEAALEPEIVVRRLMSELKEKEDQIELLKSKQLNVPSSESTVKSTETTAKSTESTAKPLDKSLPIIKRARKTVSSTVSPAMALNKNLPMIQRARKTYQPYQRSLKDMLFNGDSEEDNSDEDRCLFDELDERIMEDASYEEDSQEKLNEDESRSIDVYLFDDDETVNDTWNYKTKQKFDDEMVDETLADDETVGKTLTDEETVGETLADEEMVDETLADDETVGETLADEETVGETLADEEMVDETLADDKMVDETLAENDTVDVAVGETLSKDDAVGETLAYDEMVGETLAEDETVGETLAEDETVGETLAEDDETMEQTVEQPVDEVQEETCNKTFIETPSQKAPKLFMGKFKGCVGWFPCVVIKRKGTTYHVKFVEDGKRRVIGQKSIKKATLQEKENYKDFL